MTFESALKMKLIYVFRINDEAHRGCLKIGEATCKDDTTLDLKPCCHTLNQAAKERINQYTQTAGIAYDLLYTEATLCLRQGTLCTFNDKEVHRVLLRSGIKRKLFDKANQANEWFCCDLETVKRAITAVKQGRVYASPASSVPNKLMPSPRPRNSSNGVTRCFGTPRCVSERRSQPCKWPRT